MSKTKKSKTSKTTEPAATTPRGDITLLFLAAHPEDINPKEPSLRLDKEAREIKHRVATARGNFKIQTEWAVTSTQLLDAVNDHQPQLVHFCGHADAVGISLETEDGQTHDVDARGLCALFATVKDEVRCVVLNACETEPHARALVDYIEAAVGMNDTIDDEAAIVFASNFYRSLAAGRSVENAFEQGIAMMVVNDTGDEDVPVLFGRQDTELDRLHFFAAGTGTQQQRTLTIVLNAKLEDLDARKIGQLMGELRKLSGDIQLEIGQRSRGSTRLQVSTSDEGAAKLADLHTQGKLQTLRAYAVIGFERPETELRKEASMNFERDENLKAHNRGMIAQLCSYFRSHEHGLPEWFKNASAAYARDNTETEHRVLTLIFGNTKSLSGQPARFVALLDHVGMSVEDVEQRFANWGDPEAHLGDGSVVVDEVVEGGHGNGGKCYMTQMFDSHAYVHTVRNGRGCKYGFNAGDPHPGYFPDRRTGRGYPVADTKAELQRVLADIGVDARRLPEDIRSAVGSRAGFTLVVGIAPRHLPDKDAEVDLVRSILGPAQMQLTIQTTRIFVVQDGKPVRDCSPIELEELEPHDYGVEPRTVVIPRTLVDPVSNLRVEIYPANAPNGTLVLRTSKVAMRRQSLKTRHHITYKAYGLPVGFLEMEDISRSHWVDRMYGDCNLDALRAFETADRSILADGPETRALQEWVKQQVIEYENEFKKRDKLESSQEDKNKLQKLNQLLDKWKNKFLDELEAGAGLGGPGEASRKTKKRPLKNAVATRVQVRCPFEKAGIGVWIRATVEFFDEEGARVAAPAFNWHSSEWAVATVDESNAVVTHTPGEVDLWVETVDRKLRSDSIHIQVLDTMRVRIEPAEISLAAGKIEQLHAVVTDHGNVEHHGVFMTWLPDDSSIVTITSAGKAIARKPGTTMVYAADERCVEAQGGCKITVTPPEATIGEQSGKAYPTILLSEIDPDPLNPDGDTVHLSPEDGPVHQPTPQHVERNIWWINLQCPLARLYFTHPYGPESTEWRAYHIERYIEALVKIRLGRDYQVAETEPTFDEVERRWREVAAEVQRRALEDLRAFLEAED